MAENPRGEHQGVGGGFESSQGIDTPGVEEVPWRDETSGVTTKGEGVTGEDGWGRGGDRTPRTTQETEACKASSIEEGNTRGLGPASLIPQQVTAAEHRHPNSADSGRPEHYAR